MLKLKVGAVVKNKIGQFTKVVALKAGFVYTNGWHLKKEQAEKIDGTNGTSPVNERGFARALGETLDTDTPATTEEADPIEPEATEEAKPETAEATEEAETKPAPAKGKGKGK